MNTEIVYIEINGNEFEAEVTFNFIEGEPRITHLLPEDCQEGSPDEYEITGLYILADHNGSKVPYCINFLIEQLEEGVIEQLEDIQSERF